MENKGIGNQRENNSKNERLPPGRNFLFTIGIDEYKHCDGLYNAVKDTQDVSRGLFNKYNFEPENHFCLENKDATKDNIIDTFRKIKYLVKPNDNLIIYYSGHGEIDKDFDGSYWVLADNRKGMSGDYLPFGNLIRYIKAINTLHIVVIIDACFAGASLVNVKNIRTAILYNKASRYVVASGREEFASDGVPGENSPFAIALIEKLEASEEDLSIINLGEYVKDQTIKATEERQCPIHKRLLMSEDKGGDFVFYLKSKGEERSWYALFDKPAVSKFQAYIRKYPESKYLEDAVWEIAKLKNTIIAYDNYLESFPAGKYAGEALEKMDELEEEAAWQKALKRNTLVAYRKYLQKYNKGKYEKDALELIRQIKGKEKSLGQESEMVEDPEQIGQSRNKLIKTNSDAFKKENTFKDPRDGKVYKTIRLKDGKEWMAQNLNFDMGTESSYYNDKFRNGEKYGRLYTWEAAKKACPPGWRLPSVEEWQNLIRLYGGNRGGTGDDGKSAYHSLSIGGRSGFNSKFGGCLNNKDLFYGLNGYSFYWSSTKQGFSASWAFFSYPHKELSIRQGGYISRRFSCRCVRED